MVRSKGQKLKHLPTTSHLFFFPRLNFTPSFPAVLPFPQSRPAQRVRTGAVLSVWQRSCAAPSPLHCSLLTLKPCSGAWSTFPVPLLFILLFFPVFDPFWNSLSRKRAERAGLSRTRDWAPRSRLEWAVPSRDSPGLSAQQLLLPAPHHGTCQRTREGAQPLLKSTGSRSDLKGMQLSRYSELMETDLQISGVHWMSVKCTGIIWT